MSQLSVTNSNAAGVDVPDANAPDVNVARIEVPNVELPEAAVPVVNDADTVGVEVPAVDAAGDEPAAPLHDSPAPLVPDVAAPLASVDQWLPRAHCLLIFLPSSPPIPPISPPTL
ncbi:hypothetical protein B0T26DRAFT_752923 [Lasiosphaeria miniovina]|uniref:Uncharacterized protein n=1 Tax=Lasiosphaeria miniovina TaxID=1954250 RepID=A0AA40ABD5_9PEZI|nr:uncharacterized protein B0T26DRAFT_752923 [Lasiosphaeria miniovina]KAK0712721.1 hypothetical protein B0T26DRAFT_752923 [Lasiosphaeria miniovina]